MRGRHRLEQRSGRHIGDKARYDLCAHVGLIATRKTAA
jgi:hypothetical protein